MRIGIIGAGNIGGSLTRLLAGLGHEVRVANSRDPETLAELAAESGATAVWAKDAAEGAELVIVSVPQKNTPQLAALDLASVVPGVPVIETNNYYPKERDGRIDAIEEGTTETRWVADQLGLPSDVVYKVFNGIWWKHLLEGGLPAGDPARIALPVAGAEGPHKDLVLAIVDSLGFDPVDGGPLSESWRQQPGTPVYGKDYPAARAIAALAEAPSERPQEFRA